MLFEVQLRIKVPNSQGTFHLCHGSIWFISKLFLLMESCLLPLFFFFFFRAPCLQARRNLRRGVVIMVDSGALLFFWLSCLHMKRRSVSLRYSRDGYLLDTMSYHLKPALEATIRAS
ncbi:hypothetical protein F5Y16DRAFT_106293 [Xylariaceae sp. FL0255]|nr:hypothetical protein F5Y16DRAFT_106293 [Xylariaceae sp. FL0255]